MNKIKTIVSICLFPILLISCAKTLDQQTEVKDIRKKETIILSKKPSQDNIHSIKINISGTIEGESKISLILNNEEYKTNKLNGNCSFNWGGDWYADTAKIIYQPINAQNGNITIRYEFKDI